MTIEEKAKSIFDKYISNEWMILDGHNGDKPFLTTEEDSEAFIELNPKVVEYLIDNKLVMDASSNKLVACWKKNIYKN